MKQLTIFITGFFKLIGALIHYLLMPLFWLLKPFKKTITKYFALNHYTSIFGKGATFTRGAVIIYPLFVTLGILTCYEYINGTDYYILRYTLYILTALSVFCGFKFFDYSPVKWDGLDLIQKYSYGIAYEKNIIDASKDDSFNIEHLMYINNYVENDLFKKRFYKPLLWLFHPFIATAISLLLTLYILSW